MKKTLQLKHKSLLGFLNNWGKIMQFTREELDLILSALRYTAENGYVFRDEPEIQKEYDDMLKLMEKVFDN